MKYLEKIQKLPEKIRKIILWSVIIVLGSVLIVWWVNSFQERFKGFQGEQFIEELNLPEIEMPQMPELSEEELEKLKEALEENGQ